MAYIRCSDAIHKAVKLEAAAREISMQDLTAEAWAAYESIKRGDVNPGEHSSGGENITTEDQSGEREIRYTRELRTLVSGIKVAAEAAEQILGAPEDDGESSLHRDVEAARKLLERARGIEANLGRDSGDVQKAGGNPKQKAG